MEPSLQWELRKEEEEEEDDDNEEEDKDLHTWEVEYHVEPFHLTVYPCLVFL